MPIGLWTSQLSMLRLGLIYLPHMALALDRFLKINSPILYKSSDTTHRNTYIFDLFMSKNHYLKQKVETCLNSEQFRQTLFMRIHILKDWKYMHHSYLDNVLTQFFLVSIPLQLTTILLFFLQRNQQKCKKLWKCIFCSLWLKKSFTIYRFSLFKDDSMGGHLDGFTGVFTAGVAG